jgi:hypothetical protein
LNVFAPLVVFYLFFGFEYESEQINQISTKNFASFGKIERKLITFDFISFLSFKNSQMKLTEKTQNNCQFQKIVLKQLSPHQAIPSSSLASILVEEIIPTFNLGVWSQDEEKNLITAVEIYGNSNWKKCSNFIKTRTSKQCRDKWFTNLQPDLNKTVFEEWEDQVIIVQHQIIGNKWTLISQSLPGRTATSVKNRWHSHLLKFHLTK